jgi:hypothetical protein
LRHVTDPPPFAEPVGRRAEQLDAAGGGTQEAKEQLQERRLPGTVRPDEG